MSSNDERAVVPFLALRFTALLLLLGRVLLVRTEVSEDDDGVVVFDDFFAFAAVGLALVAVTFFVLGAFLESDSSLVPPPNRFHNHSNMVILFCSKCGEGSKSAQR